jgi:integrase
MKKNLTDKFLKNLKAPKAGRLEIFDTIVPGFGVRIGTSGRPAFFVMYRVHGKQFRQTIGKYPIWKLAEAREEAINSLRLASGGEDPKLEAIKQSKTQFKPIAEEFLDRYAKVHQKPTTYAGTKRHVEKHLIPAWGHLPIAKISRRHVHIVLDDLVDAGTGTTANRVLATTSKLFNWAVERGYIEASPATGVKAPTKEVSRDRVLTLEEIRKIWKAADALAHPWGYWVQLMFATGGQREGDISRMRWAEIRGVWWEIEEPTKSDTRHRVPLSTLSLEILDKIPRFEGPYVFSTRAGEIPVRGFSKAKKLLDEKSKVTGWRFHDIRRTVSTMFGEHLGKHPYVIERIQNRRSGTIKGVMAVYNRAGYEKEIQDALGDWGQFLKRLQKNHKVIGIHERSH